MAYYAVSLSLSASPTATAAATPDPAARRRLERGGVLGAGGLSGRGCVPERSRPRGDNDSAIQGRPRQGAMSTLFAWCTRMTRIAGRRSRRPRRIGDEDSCMAQGIHQPQLARHPDPLPARRVRAGHAAGAAVPRVPPPRLRPHGGAVDGRARGAGRPAGGVRGHVRDGRRRPAHGADGGRGRAVARRRRREHAQRPSSGR